jgi:hypothetical protein
MHVAALAFDMLSSCILQLALILLGALGFLLSSSNSRVVVVLQRSSSNCCCNNILTASGACSALQLHPTTTDCVAPITAKHAQDQQPPLLKA